MKDDFKMYTYNLFVLVIFSEYISHGQACMTSKNGDTTLKNSTTVTQDTTLKKSTNATQSLSFANVKSSKAYPAPSTPPEEDTQIIYNNALPHTNQKETVIFSPAHSYFSSIITESKMWVDKSNLIRIISEPTIENHNVYIITGPHKWGKTTNLNMLKFYYDIPLDDNRRVIAKESSPAYRYFINGKIIGKNGEEVKLSSTPLISNYVGNSEHLCQHSVIALSGLGLSYATGIEGFHFMIRKAYQSNYHLYHRMCELEAVSNEAQKTTIQIDKELFLRFLSVEQNIPKSLLEQSIQTLSELLVRYYKIKNVVILYDEHDAYLRDAYILGTSHYTEEQKETFSRFLRNFMSYTFKENGFLFRGIITGILNVAEATYLSTMNSVCSLSVFNLGKFQHLYGVTRCEFERMMTARNLNESTINQAVEWYDGYRDLEHPDEPLYCMYSAVSFLNALKFESYWGASSFDPILEVLLHQHSFLEDYDKARNNEGLDISASFFKRMSASNYEVFLKVSTGEIPYSNEHHKNVVFTVMTVLGFASISKAGNDVIAVRIPNKEIRSQFEKTEFNVTTNLLSLQSKSWPARLETIKQFIADKDNEKEIVTSLATTIHTYFLELTGVEEFVDSPAIAKEKKTYSTAATTATTPFMYSNSSNVEDFIGALFSNKPLVKILEVAGHKSIVGNEAIVQAIMTTLFTKVLRSSTQENSLIISQSRVDTAPFKTIVPDIYIEMQDVAVIIELKFGDPKNRIASSIDAAMEQCLHYASSWNRFNASDKITHVKYVAIRLDKRCVVEVKSISLSITDNKKLFNNLKDSFASDVQKLLQKKLSGIPALPLNETELDKKVKALNDNPQNQYVTNDLIKKTAKGAVYARWPQD